MATTNYLQVFEHQVLRLNDQGLTQRHLDALAHFNEQHENRYFTLLHKGVRFRQYVGVLQVGNLTIEILPKTDQYASRQQWQRVLLELLQVCSLLPLDTLTEARLQARNSPLLWFYLHHFLNEVQQLLEEGLVKHYQTKSANGNTWKGQLNFAKQLRHNWQHPERVYSNFQHYDYQHPAHQVIYYALEIVQQLTVDATLQQRVRYLLRAFPKQNPIQVKSSVFEQLYAQPKFDRYRRALELARMITLHYSPDLRAGNHAVLAILFDMNQLFERYIQRQLQQYLDKEWLIRAQASKPFWAQRKLRPDLWLSHQGKHYILDTKWKILKRPAPSDEDLRQIFAYNHSFETTQSLLVYPNVFALRKRRAAFAQPLLLAQEAHPHYCTVVFVDILNAAGQLNRQLAQDLVHHLRAS